MFTLMMMGMFIPYQTVLIPLVRFLFRDRPVRHPARSDPRPRRVWHPDHHADLPQLLRLGTQALVEAAAVDGAGILRTYRSIVLPVSLPGFVVAGIFQFTNIWNDFLFGLVVITDPRKQPVTVALNNLSGNQSVNYNVVMAGALIAAIPTAFAYIGFGRYYVEGLTAGSVK